MHGQKHLQRCGGAPLGREPEGRVRGAEPGIAVPALDEFEEQAVVVRRAEQLKKPVNVVFAAGNSGAPAVSATPLSICDRRYGVRFFRAIAGGGNSCDRRFHRARLMIKSETVMLGIVVR